MPPEALVGLRRRLDTLPGRHPGRPRMLEQAAAPYGVSPTTLYRQPRTLHRPRRVRRSDRAGTCEQFSVDGTLIDACTSIKSFRPKDGSDDRQLLVATPSGTGGGTGSHIEFGAVQIGLDC